VWFGGAAVAHDLIVVPVVPAVAPATTRVPVPYRMPLQAVLVVSGCVALIGAVPLLLM
jgi:hypothetical protein